MTGVVHFQDVLSTIVTKNTAQSRATIVSEVITCYPLSPATSVVLKDDLISEVPGHLNQGGLN